MPLLIKFKMWNSEWLLFQLPTALGTSRLSACFQPPWLRALLLACRTAVWCLSKSSHRGNNSRKIVTHLGFLWMWSPKACCMFWILYTTVQHNVKIKSQWRLIHFRKNNNKQTPNILSPSSAVSLQLLLASDEATSDLASGSTKVQVRSSKLNKSVALVKRCQEFIGRKKL